MTQKACSNCQHFEYFSCHIRGACTKFGRPTHADGSCLSFEAKGASLRKPASHRTLRVPAKPEHAHRS